MNKSVICYLNFLLDIAGTAYRMNIYTLNAK